MQFRKCSAMVSEDCELEAVALGTKSLVAIGCTLNGSGSVSARGGGRLRFGRAAADEEEEEEEEEEL